MSHDVDKPTLDILLERRAQHLRDGIPQEFFADRTQQVRTARARALWSALQMIFFARRSDRSEGDKPSSSVSTSSVCSPHAGGASR
jgi:hypothetical protein